MNIVVIIPTYNEAQGIRNLLGHIGEVATKAPEHQWSILVVDGNSPDGTGTEVLKAKESDPRIHLISEKGKQGIAMAYLTGISHAVSSLHADAFVEFDGDGQHNPDDLPRLAQALSSGYDYAIGSRYVSGGSIPKNWAFHRKVLSRFGSLYSRLLLDVPVHDVTSGLKMTRVAGFAHALPTSVDDLLTKHYAYKIQLLYAMHQAGARIIEVPIQFKDRAHDVSKSTSRDIFESLRVTALLRLATFRQWRLLRVVAIGAIGFLLQALILEVTSIQFSLLSASMAAVVGGEIAILSNFLLNERFSFTDRVLHAPLWSNRLLRFHLVSSGSICIQWILLVAAEHTTHDPTFIRATFVVGVLLGFMVNYVGYYFYVWGRAR